MEESMNDLTFQSFLSTGLRSWDVLQHAVDFGYGGQNGTEKAEWLEGVVGKFFSLNADLEPVEVEEFISEIMDNEFNVITNDDSTLQRLCREFCIAFEYFIKHKNDEVRRQRVFSTYCEFVKACRNLATASANKRKSVNQDTDSSNSDSADIDNDETLHGLGQEKRPRCSKAQTQSKTPTEPDEDGWTTVTRKK